MITVKKDKEQFQKDQDNILKFILDERFFKPWQETFFSEEERKYSLYKEARLELYLTSICNQKCEYCYLVKYPGLYPKEQNKPEIILHNLELIYQWIMDNNFCIQETDFFTGEIWHTQFGLDVLELTLQYIQKGMRICGFMIPSNCSFILDEIQTCKIQRYINKFKQYGSYLMFSVSVDGKVIENEMRPLNNKTEKTDEFYERLMLFVQHNDYYIHPMVAAKSCKNWIENYKWWRDILAEYDMDVRQRVMLLEVRNDDWTDEYIDDYNAFMKFLIDEDIKHYNGNVSTFIDQFFTGQVSDRRMGYTPFIPIKCDTFAGCTVSNTLTIRVGDLAIAPCHRTSYNKLLYGHFDVEDDKIVDITSNNVYNAIRVLMANNNVCHFGCDTCLYGPFCLHGCFGAQYEHNGDMFMPTPEVCHFFKRKWQFLANYLNEVGALDYMRSFNEYSPYYMDMQRIITWCERVMEDSKNVGTI